MRKLSKMKLASTLAACFGLGLTGTALAAAPGKTEHKEISHLQSASVSPVQAGQSAEQTAKGRAVAYGYEVNSNADSYEVTTASKSGLHVTQIDPTSGKTLNSRSEASNALSGDGLPASAINKAASAKVTLISALKSVSQQANGNVLEASYAMHQGTLAIDVDVAANGSIESYRVDPQTGSVRKIRSSESETQEGQASESGQDKD